MNLEKSIENVKDLIEKSAKAETAPEAVAFSRAAMSCADALASIKKLDGLVA